MDFTGKFNTNFKIDSVSVSQRPLMNINKITDVYEDTMNDYSDSAYNKSQDSEMPSPFVGSEGFTSVNESEPENNEPTTWWDEFTASTLYKGGYASISKFASGFSEKIIGDKTFGCSRSYAFESIVVFVAMLAAGNSFWDSLKKALHTEGKQVTKKWLNSTSFVKGFQNSFDSNLLGMQMGLGHHMPAAASFGDKFAVVFQGLGSSTFKYFGATMGINVVFNIAWDLINADGKIELGTDIYKGSVMTVFAISGKIIGSVFGGKATEVAFSMAGAFVAETTVKWYETEVGRGIAGAAIVVGGAVALIVGIAAGWAIGLVGLAVLAGAAIGGFIVWGIEKIVVHWPEIEAFFVNTWNSAVEKWNEFADWAISSWESTKAVVVETWNSFVDWGTDALNSTKDFAVELFDEAVELAADAWNNTIDYVTETWDNTVDFITDINDGVSDFGTNLWDGAVDFATDLQNGTNFFDATANLAHDVKESVVELATDTWDASVEVVTETWETVSSAAADAWNDTVDALNNVVCNAGSWLCNLFT